MRTVNYLYRPPFKGYVYTWTYYDEYGDELVATKDNPSLSDFLQDNPNEFEVVSDAKLSDLIEQYDRSLITKPERISRERYWEMLEVLPPCRWGGGFFHVSERITGSLVSWFLEADGKYWEFTNLDYIKQSELDKIKSECLEGIHG